MKTEPETSPSTSLCSLAYSPRPDLSIGIGFGPVVPDIPAGQIVQQSNALAQSLHVLFGQTEAAISYDGLAPSAIGFDQFNVVVPNVAASDAVPLTFTLGGIEGTQTLYTAVQ